MDDAPLTLVERLRAADMNSLQRVNGSRIFKEAADEIERLRAALRIFVGCAYPVATEINPRGHDWRPEESLDYALSEAKKALAFEQSRDEKA